jgi:hypothetical protein
MRTILATGIVVILVYFINSYFYRRNVRVTLSMIAPLVEEVSKTTIPLVLGGSIFYVHMLFGMIEGVRDLFLPGRGDFLPALSAIFCHTFYGSVTLVIYRFTKSYGLSIAGAFLAHAMWNYFVLSITRNKRKG